MRNVKRNKDNINVSQAWLKIKVRLVAYFFKLMKNISINIIILSLVFIVSPITSFADGLKTDKIFGKLADKETGAAIEFAAVQLLHMPDSAQVGGVASDRNGNFSLPLNRTGELCLKISYMGYKTIYFPIVYKSLGSGDIVLDKLLMSSDAIMLDEALVVAEIPPLQMEGDTLVYNTAAFKVTEGAVLEELVEKLPGAEIEEDGKVNINGKEVKKLYVNGKEFFGGNIKTGLQNLPVDMIEQLKTYDRESDMERMTGIDDGEDEMVLDVRFKKDRNRGWFGNVDLGGGTEERYGGKTMINKFSDATQYSFIASANNIADKNFSSGARSNWKINRGIVESQNVGFNMAINKEKYEFGGSVNFRRNEDDTRSNLSSERFYTDRTTYTNSSSNSLSKNINLRSDFRFEYRINDKTTLLVRPNISYTNGKSFQNSNSQSFGNEEYTDSINANVSDNNSESVKKNATISAMLSRKIGDSGRNIAFRVGAGHSESESGKFNDNTTHYYKIYDAYGNDSINYRSRLVTNDNVNNNYSAQVTYSEPFYGIGILQLSYQFLYKNTEGIKTTFDRITELEIDSLGKSAKYDYYNHDISVSFRLVREKYNLSVGASIQPQRSVLSYEKALRHIDTVRTVINFAPKIDFRYKFSKTSQIRFNYHGKSSQPGMESLLPVVENSNPLNIKVGNPGLAPSFAHSIRLNLNTYNSNNFSSFIMNGSVNIVQNSISNMVEYNDLTGGRITTPVNVNGDWRGSVTLGYNTSLKNKKFSINVKSSAGFTNNVGFIYNSKEHSTLKNTTTETKLGGELRGSFRNSAIELTVNSAISYSFEKDEKRPFYNQEPYSYSYGASFTAFMPWNISFSTNLVNQCRRGYSDPLFNRNECIWNAKVSKTFFSGSTIVSVEAFDILGQKSNIQRKITSSLRSVGEYNGINSYVMAHLVYRFKAFNGRKMNVGKGGRGGMRMRKSSFSNKKRI